MIDSKRLTMPIYHAVQRQLDPKINILSKAAALFGKESAVL
jgi:hypothetical protein